MKRRLRDSAEDFVVPVVGIGVSIAVMGVIGVLGYNYIKSETAPVIDTISDTVATVYGDVKETLAPIGDVAADVLTVSSDIVKEGGAVVKEGVSVLGKVTKSVGGLVKDGVEVADSGIRYTGNTISDGYNFTKNWYYQKWKETPWYQKSEQQIIDETLNRYKGNPLSKIFPNPSKITITDQVQKPDTEKYKLVRDEFGIFEPASGRYKQEIEPYDVWQLTVDSFANKYGKNNKK